MSIVEIPPDEFGLITVAEAAAIHGCDVRTVQRWIAGGLLPALVCGSGNRTAYMVRSADAKAFVPRTAGRPPAPKPPAQKPTRRRGEK